MPEKPVQQAEPVLKSNPHCPPDREINILLLGPTRTGKSTLINALRNYIVNDTLDEAVNDQMQVIIPSSFTFTDPNTFDEKTITIGKEDEYEQFKNIGQSNTQQCRSFVFPIGNRNLRLIDTPGIGDTRGIEQDAKLFQEILTYTAQYEHLNGVCMVLKPDEEHLTVLFQTCIIELLRHLHLGVKDNIIFVFTNVRSNSDMPEITKKILQERLHEHCERHKVEVPLSRENIFLLDNKPFRYLALCKNGIQLDNEQTQSYIQSWNINVKEYVRLMEHIVTRPPHAVSNTLSLNEAEQLVRKLARPIAETTRLIEENIQLAKEYKKKVFENPRIVSQGIPQNDVVIVPLRHPQTVCTGASCCRVTGVGAEKKMEYLSICHDECYLKGVVQETLADPQLQDCTEMDPDNGSCLTCGCSWRKHKHITYKCDTRRIHARSYATGRTTTNKDMSLVEIDKRIGDLRKEEIRLQDAYQKLAQFLHANAILPINDGYIEYLQYFIREEQMKQNAGAHNTEVIASLEKMTDDYNNQMELFKETLQGQIPAENDVEILKPEDVFLLVGDLYRLPINGQQIRKQVQGITIGQERSNAQREVFVELPAKAASSKMMVEMLECCSNGLSSDTVPVMFSAEAPISLPINLSSNILQFEKYTTDKALDFATSQLNADRCFLVTSQKMASDELLSNTQLLRYYFFIPSCKIAEMKSKEHVKVTCVSSASHLFNELCNDLSQYYHDIAHQALNKQGNRTKAKRLLTKSTKCREILLDETEKRLKRYVDTLLIQDSDKQEPK